VPVTTYDDLDACAGTPLRINLTNVDEAARCEWNVVDKPAGSQVTFADDAAMDGTEITVTEDGAYHFQVCCFFEEGSVQQVDAQQPTLSCALGVRAGDTAFVSLSGCENGTVEWSTLTPGVLTSISGDVNGATITTDPDSAGFFAVEAICREFDIDGNETVSALLCFVNVIPQDTELVCTTSPAVDVTFVPCGVRCECTEFVIIFDCEDAERCQTECINFFAKECPDPEEARTVEECADCYDDPICCDEHRPVLMWNSLCACPGWEFEAPAIEGSSFHNACSCNIGSQWCFEGSATIVASGPATFVDVMVIWGHNISDGQVTTAPLAPFGGGPTGIGVVNDTACIEGFTQPVIINFDQVPSEGITDFMATIESNGNGPVCIDQVFIGQKMFLPNDLLPLSFVNPHHGDDYSLETKESACGIISRSIQHEPCDWSLEICASDDWLCERSRTTSSTLGSPTSNAAPQQTNSEKPQSRWRHAASSLNRN